MLFCSSEGFDPLDFGSNERDASVDFGLNVIED